MSSVTELLYLLIALWLPGQPTGTPASAEAALRYLPPQAQLALTLDAGSLLKPGLAQFRQLGEQPFIKGVPQLNSTYQRARKELEQVLQQATALGGVDPAKDLRYVSFAVVVGEPSRWVAVLGGNLGKTVFKALLQLVPEDKQTKLPGGRFFPPKTAGKPALAWTNDDVVLAGSPKLVKLALSKKPRTSGTTRFMARLHDPQTYAAVALRPDGLPSRVTRSMDPMMRDLWGSLTGVYLGLRYDGLRLALRTKNAKTLTRCRPVLDGLGLSLSGAEYMLRGALELANGVLPGRAEAKKLPAPLAQLAAQKPALYRYISARLPRGKVRHVVKMDRKGKTCRLDYKGLRVMGLVAAAGLLGAGNEVGDRLFSGARKLKP